MIFRKIMFILFLGLLSCSKDNDLDKLNLPFDEKTIWVYEVTGYSSYVLNLGQKFTLKGESNDTISINNFYDSLMVGNSKTNTNISYDTINVFVTKISYFNKDSTIYRFNIDFVRFWGSEIIKTKSGYKSILGNSESHYLIKFPIRLKNTWENRYSLVSEICAITAIDTTIQVRDKEFKNCVQLTILRSVEGYKSKAKIYFNEEQGLVYYKDNNYQDELILIEMKPKY